MTTTLEGPAAATAAGEAAVDGARARNGRLEFLDTLRGIAALVVVLHHANYMLASYWGPAMLWLLDW